MEIVSIEEIEKGDLIVIQTHEKTVDVHTVKEVMIDENLIISEESYPLDFYVESESVVRLNSTY